MGCRGQPHGLRLPVVFDDLPHGPIIAVLLALFGGLPTGAARPTVAPLRTGVVLRDAHEVVPPVDPRLREVDQFTASKPEATHDQDGGTGLDSVSPGQPTRA
jgi:hypothetical protein